MKILYHFPNPTTIFAGRSIAHGYKNAFTDTGHAFDFLTPDVSIKEAFEKNRPDIFFTSIGPLYFKYLDFDVLSKAKKLGTKIFVSTPFWNSPFSKSRINEVPSLSENAQYIKAISSDSFGDVYYGYYEADDPRMDGFEKTTGRKYYSIPLAADVIALKSQDILKTKYKADISFIGTYLPEKREFFSTYVFPLKSKYILRLYGQDWTYFDRLMNMAQRVGQYFNIPVLKSIKKQPLDTAQEASVYLNSTISINVHEDYQKKFGGDCNERTFKIPACGGFEITDRVSCISKYFEAGKEIVVADKSDWFDKIEYYLKNPEQRQQILEAGKKRALKDHTYHNRISTVLDIYRTLV